MATAASRTTSLLLLGLILAVVSFVVSNRRSDAPWARGFVYYLYLALFIVGLRVVFRVLFDAGAGATVLFTIPEVPLPEAAAGIGIGGAVTAEAILAAVRDGLRLATLIICLGAANVLANPKRLLASVPGALHEIAVAVTVALSVAPQLVESAQRVNRARRLRGDVGRRTHVLRDIVVPVATDALDRSLLLAAAMDSRGHGRRSERAGESRFAGFAVLGGLLGVCIGTYAMLDASVPRFAGLPVLVAGLALAAVGFFVSGRRVEVTRYRPDPWRLPEWGVATCGLLVAVLMIWLARVDPLALNPSVSSLGWPQLPVMGAMVIAIGLLPAWIAPPVELGTQR